MSERNKRDLLDAIRRSIKSLDEVEALRDKFEWSLPHHYEKQRDDAYEQFGKALDSYILSAYFKIKAGQSLE